MAQAVDRTDRNAGSDAARPHLAIVPTDADLTDRLLLPLLPVRSLRELSIGLAQAWREWSTGPTAALTINVPEISVSITARVSRRGLAEITETPLAAASATESPPVPAISLPARAPLSAWVVLDGGYPSDSAVQEEAERMATWSARLVEQAISVEVGRHDFQALQFAKSAAMAELAAGAGHEINNPLATISGRVQMLLRDEADAGRRQNLAIIGGQALRIRDMIGDLMTFGRPPVPQPKRLLLNDVVRQVVDRFQQSAKSRGCQLALQAAGPIFATADSTQLQVALAELVRNSLESVAEGGEICVDLSRQTWGNGSCAVVTVSDDGAGLTARDRLHLFDPFYSGRDAGRGLGFGLCKCWRIVTNHGGWIEVDSVPRVTTAFRIFLPDDADCAKEESPCVASRRSDEREAG